MIYYLLGGLAFTLTGFLIFSIMSFIISCGEYEADNKLGIDFGGGDDVILEMFTAADDIIVCIMFVCLWPILVWVLGIASLIKFKRGRM